MKKILSAKIKGWNVEGLAAKLKRLVAADAEIAAERGEITVREAWALSGERVKVRVEVRLPDQSYRALTRVVAFPLGPELKRSYIDWAIIVTPSWYGFGWRLLDENGDMVGESAEDVGSSVYAEENAKREVNRLIGERAMGETHAPSYSSSPPSKRLSAAKRRVPATKSPATLSPIPQRGESLEIALAHADQQSALPAIITGHQTPELIGRVEDFYLSVARIFEAWVNRCHSPHTRRAYRADVMGFVEFMKFAWPKDATELLKVNIAAVLDFRGYMNSLTIQDIERKGPSELL